MKIVCLNVWGGRLLPQISEFLRSRTDVDIFCFQEVYSEAEGKDDIWTDGPDLNTLAGLTAALPDYDVYYHPHLEDWWGLAMFVRKSITVTDSGEHFVHLFKGHNLEIEKLGHTAKNLQYVTMQKESKKITILNFHGLWNGMGKDDTPERILQSKEIVSFLKGLEHEYVLCGDFNLSPETESMRILETELSVRSLIKEYGINSTRTALYTKPNKFADYILVSKGLEVSDFAVLEEVLSDHAALYVEVV